MCSAPRRVSWVIVLLFFASSGTGGFGKAVSGLPCAPGLDCENTKCLTVGGLASCCTCISWDSHGACLEWESSDGQQGTHCNFDVDMYHKSMTNLDSLGDDSCPANISCEDQRCRDVNGVTECCMCTAWEKSGDCKPDGWRSSAGDACNLSSGQAPPTSMPEPGGCPPGVSCEDTKCRNHNGSNTCCRCHRWQSNGRCKATGWLRESGMGACDFSADNPKVRAAPAYKVIQRSPLSFRGQQVSAMLDNQVVSVPVERNEADDATDNMSDNNMGDEFSMPDPPTQIDSASSASNGDSSVVQPPTEPNINANPPSDAQVGGGVQTNNDVDQQPQVDVDQQARVDVGDTVPTNDMASSVDIAASSVGGGGPHNHADGQSHKRLRKLLTHHKGGCGLNVNCESQQCYTMKEQSACCICDGKWDKAGRCIRWVSSTNGSACNFSVSD